MADLISTYTSITAKHRASGKHESADETANPYRPSQSLCDSSPIGRALFYLAFCILHFAFCILHFAFCISLCDALPPFSTINIFVEKVELFLHNVQIF